VSEPIDKVAAALRQLVEAVDVPRDGELYQLSFHVQREAGRWEVDMLSLTLAKMPAGRNRYLTIKTEEPNPTCPMGPDGEVRHLFVVTQRTCLCGKELAP
jgi:hypothetical protein